jgi:hypothetical protein
VTTLIADVSTVPLWRRITLAALGIATGTLATLLIPGALALTTSWTSGGAEIIHRVHGVGFGAIMTLCIGLPFAAQVHRPERKASLVQAGIVATLAVIAALALGGEAGQAPQFIVFLAAAAVVVAVHPAQREILTMSGSRIDRVLLTMAGLGAGPLLAYTWFESAAQRAAAVTDPHALPPHYAGMASLALGILGLAVVAALRASAYRGTAALAGLATVALGAVSLLNPGFVSALHPVAAVAAVLGGGAFIAAAYRDQPAAG